MEDLATQGTPLTSSNGHHPPESSCLTAEALVALYNASIPVGHPQVTRLTKGRHRKARESLEQFPEREFWIRVFAEIGQSQFLLGRRPSPGHETFKGNFDWLLAKGKDGIENAAKVAEGRYRDHRGGAEDDDDAA